MQMFIVYRSSGKKFLRVLPNNNTTSKKRGKEKTVDKVNGIKQVLFDLSLPRQRKLPISFQFRRAARYDSTSRKKFPAEPVAGAEQVEP